MDSFFSLSKLFWFLAAPDHLLVWLMLLGLFLLWLGKRRLAGWLLSIDLLLLMAVLLMPLGDAVLCPLESRFKQPDLNQIEPAGIVILGGGENPELSSVWQQSQFNAAAERVMVIPALAKRFPEAKIIFTGGSGSVLRQSFKGADGVADYLGQIGLADRVLLENQSRNTYENALLSAKLLGAVPDKPWLLVTSAFHMPRSVGIFEKQGWQVIPYPVDYYTTTTTGFKLDPRLWRNMRDLHTGLREWIGLVVYYLTDKTDQLLPGES
ncbi:hypothetical protein XMD579_000566 [Marinobacterium sp. xm-d-579]|uniref:YdcF family protein n=1 Tax=Marinobacterium sp. xm-d-579 TaxID=2497734 RepID=UPI001568CFA7|nr:YdcF family protein [Marinobacterium sp. xm-d-579]NRP35759.1 hypothetical protein [Marinobacterium sp. xm-d-579]